ncbi:MAG TPA: hypothetical protein VF742_05970 [Terracidiphilus sp.]
MEIDLGPAQLRRAKAAELARKLRILEGSSDLEQRQYHQITNLYVIFWAGLVDFLIEYFADFRQNCRIPKLRLLSGTRKVRSLNEPVGRTAVFLTRIDFKKPGRQRRISGAALCKIRMVREKQIQTRRNGAAQTELSWRN